MNKAAVSRQYSPKSAQVRVLTGLSEGEIVSLNDGAVILGGSEDCDLFLAEPNISGAVCSIELSAAGLRLSSLKTSGDKIQVKEDAPVTVHDSVNLAWGEKFSINGIWLLVEETVSSVYSDSSAPKNSRSDASVNSFGEAKMSLLDRKKAALAELKGKNQRIQKISMQKRESKKVSGFNTQPSHLANEKEQANWFKPFSIILLSLGISLWTISVARGISSESDSYVASTSFYAKQAAVPAHDEVLFINQLPASGAGYDVGDMTTESEVQAGDIKQAYVKHLQAVFKKMLMARELPVAVKLEQEGNSLVVEGTLPPQQQKVLQRMLVRFQVEQGIESEIINRVSKEEKALPFEIVQVTSGRYGNIVTDSGERLYVGDEYDGYQLVAIQSHHVIFSGKSRVTVEW